MTHDPETGEVGRMPVAIASAIIAVKKQIKLIGQDERNEHGKYRYVSVDRFYERVGPMMADAGLALLIDETDSEVKEGKSGSPWLFAHYALSFMHESGAVSAPMRRSLAMPINGPQTYGAAQSYIEKQFLRQVFKIPTGEKDADEIAQGDDAPARARTAPPSGNGARQYLGRQQAAPAPSEAAEQAKAKTRQMLGDIDAMESPDMLHDIDKWLAFEQLDRLLAEAVPDARAATLDMLRTRAANRRRKLLGSDGLEAFDGR